MSQTMASNPEKWEGPGLLLSVSRLPSAKSVERHEHSQEVFACIGGPRAGIAMWEQRWLLPVDVNSTSVLMSSCGDPQLLDDFSRGSTEEFSFEMDLSWNSSDERELAWKYIDYFLPEELGRLIKSLPPIAPLAANENRRVSTRSDIEAKVIDLPINTLPSSRQRSRQMVSSTRWVRLVITHYGHVALWHEVSSEEWNPSDVPWPHNGIPSRNKPYLESIQKLPLTPIARLEEWIKDTVVHERYFLNSWYSETEYWQDATFAWLTGGITADDVEDLRGDLGTLSGYLTSVRWTQRALLKQSEESVVDAIGKEALEQLQSESEKFATDIAEGRKIISECFSILATVFQRVQEEAAAQTRKNSERMNQLVTVVTALLLVPTVVSGVYGANVRVLADGAKGSLSELLVLMCGFALYSYGLLSIASKKWINVALGLIFGTIAMAVYKIPIALPGGQEIPYLSVLSLLAFIVALSAVSLRERKNEHS